MLSGIVIIEDGIFVIPMGIPMRVASAMERIIPPLTFLLSKKSINKKPISANATFGWAKSPKLKTFLLASAMIIPAWRNPMHEINKPIPAPRAIFTLGDNFYYEIPYPKEAHGHKY